MAAVADTAGLVRVDLQGMGTGAGTGTSGESPRPPTPSTPPTSAVRATVTVLSNSVGGAPLTYANDLDVALNGTVFFTSSTEMAVMLAPGADPPFYDTMRSYLLNTFRGDATGRLLAWDPETGATREVHTIYISISIDSFRGAKLRCGGMFRNKIYSIFALGGVEGKCKLGNGEGDPRA